MLSLSLKTSRGETVWLSDDAPASVAAMPALWGAANGTFRPSRPPEHPLPIWDGRGEVELEGSTIHGRSCYLGQDHLGRHFFAKGVGWVHSRGWEPSHGNCGVFPRWGAERERDFALKFACLGAPVVRPVAIIAHRSIPDARGGSARAAAEVLDLDGQPACPCMYVYSSAVRWRLADLCYLSEADRRQVCGRDGSLCDWLRALLGSVGRSCGLLHAAGGHDYSLTSHNVYCDGMRVDFEYAYLPALPHREAALNADASVWRDKELDGLRRLAWETAELLQVNAAIDEVTSWWEIPYRTAFGQNA